MKYYTKAFGCQMNYSDAERISTFLEKYKIKKALSIDKANLIIFVTCGVRQSAEDRTYGQINNIRKKYPKKKIILTGCLAHRKDVQRRLKEKVDLFCEIKNFESLALRNSESSARRRKKPSFEKMGLSSKDNDYLKIAPKYSNSYTAYIPIMTGCNNFCSYCVVPYARGREYSRPAEDILKEVRSLVKKGYKEIMLLGQNVNSYKSKNTHNTKKKTIIFPDLLKLIDSIPGKFWLTFLTSHPKDMSDELIETIAQSKKICEYISLPAQSGNNEVLRRMNRKYTIEHYKDLIKKIRKSFLELKAPIGALSSKLSPSISTDIIVGFPGETKNQFESSAKLLREMKFDMAYIAQYSPRPETAAWKMKGNVSKKEKARREKILTEILAKTAFANNRKYIGKTMEVLVDKRFDLEEFKKSLALGNPESSARQRKKPSFESKFEKYKYLAHTRTQKKVMFFSNKKIPVGSFRKIKITKAKAFGLEGEIKIARPETGYYRERE
jgi:tRNA-2-methylthio-N6-dimethylallyladenosine synthase